MGKAEAQEFQRASWFSLKPMPHYSYKEVSIKNPSSTQKSSRAPYCLPSAWHSKPSSTMPLTPRTHPEWIVVISRTRPSCSHFCKAGSPCHSWCSFSLWSTTICSNPSESLSPPWRPFWFYQLNKTSFSPEHSWPKFIYPLNLPDICWNRWNYQYSYTSNENNHFFHV